MPEPLHRIYLPKIPLGIVHVPDGTLGAETPTRTYTYSLGLPPTEQIIKDYTVFPYMIEELIAVSAISFVLPDAMKEKVAAACLVGSERLTFVDVSEPNAKAKTIIDEIQEDDGPLGYIDDSTTEKGALQAKAWPDLWNLYDGLTKLFVGIDHMASIDIDTERLIGSCVALRTLIASEKPRLVLSSLQGMLSSYRKEVIPGLARIASDQRAHVEVLTDILNNSQYRNSCEVAHRFGLPGGMTRKIRDLRRHLGDVLSNSTFKAVFNFGTRVFEVFTHVPLPDSEVVSLFEKGGFMPPVIATGCAVTAALERWKNATGNEDVQFF